MIVGVPRELVAGERRVALVPGALQPLVKAGATVLVERGAGEAAGYPDAEYQACGAELVAERAQVFARADVIAQVNTYAAAGEAASGDLARLRDGQVVIGLADPLGQAARVAELAGRGVTAFGLELIPRITRAQSMDVLSSMATVAGYKAVLMAANRLPRMFPMLMTAAGTLKPARVLIMGAGVAGLQAIATAKRLGAVVSGYDVRSAVREQIESLGGRFVDLGLETENLEDKGGYAREQSEEFLRRQREAMTRVVADSDVVITTAAIPGKRSPILVTAPMVEAMSPGSVIIDLGAERGGNCELTRPGEEIVEHGVTIVGPINVPSTVPYHASQMYARNLATFLKHLTSKEGALQIDTGDEITAGTLMCRAGEVVHPRLRDLLGLPALPAPAAEAAAR
ncbi:MAG TPA: Re/Si-specific NAD(P)(+) transhydrogenase subunit alpha [Kofleriaceae bacterium]|nr:Re/Si-specific NAD(P)(+) transhydrogenase subunit alpha [Kofleriaceae bacterium]